MRPLSAALVLCSACVVLDVPPTDDAPTEGVSTEAVTQLYPGHRLNRHEYRLEVRRLLGVDSEAINNLPMDPAFGGLRSIASALDVSPYLVDTWSTAATDVARRAVEGPSYVPPPTRRTTWYRHHEHPDAFLAVAQLVGRNPPLDVHLWRDAGADLEVSAALAGLHLLEVTACVPSGGLDAAEVEIDVDGVTVAHGVVDGPCDAPTTLGAEVFLDTLAHTVSLRLSNGHDGVDVSAPPTVGRNVPGNVALVALNVILDGPYDLDAPLPPLAAALAVCSEGDLDCALEALDELAARAWRRPLQPEEVDGLHALVEGIVDEGLSINEAVAYGVRGLLMSPHFLFRLEAHTFDGEVPDTASAELEVYELAARLSFFLWRRGPDEALRACAETGALASDVDGPCSLQAQVVRMMADPAMAGFVEEFSGAWLGLDDLVSTDRDDPGFTPEIGALMRREAHALMAYYVGADLPFTGILDHGSTWVDDSLAAFYDLPLPGSGPDLQEVPLDAQGRRGLIQLGGVLVATSNEQRTIPPRRADWILQALYCTEIGGPPVDVPLAEGPTAAEALATHTDPACAGCHMTLDPLGLALERWGPSGRHRDVSDEGASITVDVTLPSGVRLHSAADLGPALRADPRVQACLVRKVLALATGTKVGSADATSEQIAAAEQLNAGLPTEPSFLDIVQAIVRDPSFLHGAEAP